MATKGSARVWAGSRSGEKAVNDIIGISVKTLNEGSILDNSISLNSLIW